MSRIPKDYLVLAVLVLGAYGLSTWLRSHADTSDGAALRAEARPGDIVMLGSTTCTYCASARRWLDAQQVPYHECLIEREPGCLREYEARGARGTPTFVVRGQTVVGFDREQILKLISRS
ncbi:MAG TPA: glutaredoxin family protein [Burkholderiaceae bacterium]|jgi:glutaredoxin